MGNLSIRSLRPSGLKRGSGWKYSRLRYSSTAWSSESGDGLASVAEGSLVLVSLCADYTAQSGAYQDTETSSLMLTLFIRLEALSTKDPDLFVCLGRESGVKTEPLLDEAA